MVRDGRRSASLRDGWRALIFRRLFRRSFLAAASHLVVVFACQNACRRCRQTTPFLSFTSSRACHIFAAWTWHDMTCALDLSCLGVSRNSQARPHVSNHQSCQNFVGRRATTTETNQIHRNLHLFCIRKRCLWLKQASCISG